MSEFAPEVLADGTVIQAGCRTSWTDIPFSGYWSRAVVLQVYFSDSPTWAARGWMAQGIRCVCADVRLYGRMSRVLSRVPVLQRVHSLHDEDLWIPRAARQNIGGGTLVVAASATQALTPAEKLDADHVIVAFLENDTGQPVILPLTAGHPAAAAIKASGGRVRRIRHHGTAIDWDASGNLTLDARGAAAETLGAKGAEVSTSGTGGKIVIETKDGAGAVSSVQLDNLGGVALVDAGGGKVALAKAGTISVDGKSQVTVSAPAVSLTATGAVTLKGATVGIGALSTSITIGPLPQPVVQATLLLPQFANLLQTAVQQIAVYDGGAASVSVSDYSTLLKGLKAVCEAVALSPTKVTKVG